jgi:PhoPQ-activated pathogenicity-related protein
VAVLALLLAWLVPAAAAPPAPEAGLAAFVAAPDPALAWATRQSGLVWGARYRELVLTSQRWQGAPWRHQFFVVCPGNAEPGRPALLAIAGGDWRDRYLGPPDPPGAPPGTGRYRDLARRIRAPVAVLLQVPAQPLLGGLTEDALIAASFARYLDGAGAGWPLLLPMVKAGSAALTALAAVAADDCGVRPERFIVTGASKRGWTAWLLAAADPRVAGVAPTVFDAVRLDAHVAHQASAWGALSGLLRVYAPLVDRLETPAGQRLLDLVDPWRHRARLTMPKLVVLATNDAFFPADSANLYVAGVAPASLLYLPNQGHGARDPRRIAAGLVALADAVATGTPLPVPGLAATVAGDAVEVTVTAPATARAVRLWVARSPNDVFRYEPYVGQRLRRRADGRYGGSVPLAGGYVAVFGEAEFGRWGRRYRLSTPLLRIGADGVVVAGGVSARGSGGSP